MNQIRFQYPLLDRYCWNTTPSFTKPSSANAFSIHFWIDIVETWTAVHTIHAIRSFQYPLLDRYCWNSPPQFQHGSQLVLSVSTSGSILLKLSFRRCCCIWWKTFSIHFWIDIVETKLIEAVIEPGELFQYPLLDRYCWNQIQFTMCIYGWMLSVSTSGSILLKPTGRFTCLAHILDFQYPLLDRYCWNDGLGRTLFIDNFLSVSTSGSILLKPSSPARIDIGFLLSVSTSGSILLKLHTGSNRTISV